MSLTSNINLLGSRIATEFRTIRGLISGSETGNVSALTTTSQNLVGAINEVKAAVDAGGGGGSADTGDITFSGGTMLGTSGLAKIATQSTTTTGSYSLVAGVDYSTAVWDNNTVTFNDTTQGVYDAVWALSSQFDTISLMINGNPVLVTSSGSTTPGVPQPVVLFLNETAVGGPLTVESVEITTRTGAESYVEVDGTDFRVDVQDDVRIYGSDTFRLSNRSLSRGITIDTYDNEHIWEFTVDGHLLLPAGGDIRDENGSSVLSNVQINDEVSSSTTVYSSSKIDGIVDGAALVAAFEAALNS